MFAVLLLGLKRGFARSEPLSHDFPPAVPEQLALPAITLRSARPPDHDAQGKEHRSDIASMRPASPGAPMKNAGTAAGVGMKDQNTQSFSGGSCNQ
jgi:hypothetical protein